MHGVSTGRKSLVIWTWRWMKGEPGKQSWKDLTVKFSKIQVSERTQRDKEVCFLTEELKHLCPPSGTRNSEWGTTREKLWKTWVRISPGPSLISVAARFPTWVNHLAVDSCHVTLIHSSVNSETFTLNWAPEGTDVNLGALLTVRAHPPNHCPDMQQWHWQMDFSERLKPQCSTALAGLSTQNNVVLLLARSRRSRNPLS